jgi:glycosyltransferase involved in cell wall biosynthesis
MTPKVSVLIAAYNAEQFLAEAIESALSQDCDFPVEVVVVDDGSTDGTAEVLRSFGDAVRVVRQANAGPSSARNHGAQVARGEWLAFLDADDVWEPSKLRRQLELVGDATTLVYSDRESFGDGTSHRWSDTLVLPEGDVFEQLVRANFITLSSVVIRRDTFHRLDGFNEELFAAEDWDLWLRHCSTGEVRVVRRPLVRYRRHEGCLTRNPERMIGPHMRVVHRALHLPRCREWDPQRIRAILGENWRVCGAYAERVRPRWAAACYARSILYDPVAPDAYRDLVRASLKGVPLPTLTSSARAAAAAAAAAVPVDDDEALALVDETLASA